MNILLVTYNWPPRNAIGTHRPLSWAKYWSKEGCKVTVLTAKKKKYDRPLDMPMTQLPLVDVIEVNYQGGVADNIFLSQGNRNLLRKIASFRRFITLKNKEPRDKWFSAITEETFESLSINHDVIVSTFGPAVCHRIANKIKKKNPKIIWIADYRDLWVLPFNMWRLFARRNVNNLEKRSVGTNADCITTVSKEMSEVLSEKLKITSYMIPNGYDVYHTDLENDSVTQSILRKETFNIVYTGTIYKGSRDPSPLFKALDIIKANNLPVYKSIRVHVFGERTSNFINLAKSYSVSENVINHGHVAREIALACQCRANLLLLLERPGKSGRGILTGKVFEYIASGVPVMSLGSDSESSIAKLLNEVVVGKCYQSDKEKIAETLVSMVSTDKKPDWFNPNEEKIKKYSREVLALQYLKIIKQLCSHEHS